MTDQTRFVLPESEIPMAWYNIQADLLPQSEVDRAVAQWPRV